MDMILTGSRAIKHNSPNFREPRDVDYIVSEKLPYRKKDGVDYFYMPSFFKYTDMYKDGVVTLKGMFNIKSTILMFEVNSKKHLDDLRYLLVHHIEDCVVNPDFIKEQREFLIKEYYYESKWLWSL